MKYHIIESLHCIVRQWTRSTSKMKPISVALLLFCVLSHCCHSAQVQYRVEYVLIADTCCEHSNVKWSANVGLEYRTDSTMSWERLRNFTDIENTDTQLCNKTAINNNFANDTATLLYTRQGSFPPGYDVEGGEDIQLRFVQTNHRGGSCDCWSLACDILLLNSSGHIVNTINEQQIFCNDLQSNSGSGSGDATSGSGACPSDFPMVTECLPFYVCGGSASVERGFITEFNDQASCRAHSSDTFRNIAEQRQHNIEMNDDCNVTEPYLKVAFAYNFRSLDSFDEGFELSFRNGMNGGGTWIPLWYFSAHESTNRTVHDISLQVGDITNDGLLNLRGYTINYSISENNISEAEIRLCGLRVFNEQAAEGLYNWRFRWLQTVAKSSTNDEDVIYIYNVSITVVNDTQVQLFHDDFSSEGNKLSTEKWFVQRNVKQQKNCSGGLHDSCLEFSSTGEEPDCAVPVTSREASTVCLNSITQIQYTLITASSSDCPGSGTLLSKFQFPQLQYQWMSLVWTDLNPGDPVSSVLINEFESGNITRHEVVADLRHLNRLVQCSFSSLRFRFIQKEHRGGFCDCWAVANLTATLTSGEVRNLRKSCGNNINLEDLPAFTFTNDPVEQWDGTNGYCRDSASVARVFQTRSGSEYNVSDDKDGNMKTCDIEANPPYSTNDCDDLKIEVAFDLTFHFESCDQNEDFGCCDETEDFSEGVEFSVKRNNGEWIPLMFIAPHLNITEPFIKLSENIDNEFTLRGYTVPYVIQTTNVENYNISICRNNIFRDKLQFRWLQTSYQMDEFVRDVVMLDNVHVRAGNCSTYVTLLPFINSSLWDTALSYNIHPQCSPTYDCSCRKSSTDAMFFYQHSVNLTRMFDNENYTITSRQAVTTEINLNMLNATVPLPYRCQPTPPTSTTTKDNLFHVQESLSMKNLSVITTTSNLSSILGEVKDQTIGLEISKLVLLISSQLLDIALNNFEAELVSPNDYLAGSTLLRLLENFALNNHDASYPLVDSNNIILRVEEVSINSTNERISLIKGENATISIPREVIANVEGRESVRVVSLLYRNMSGLLPESLGMNDDDTDDDILRLASPVISMSVQCDDINCTTSDLSTPVEVTFTHTPYDMALLEDDSSFNATVTCVFWKFYPYDKQPEPLLFPGRWSTEGCERNLKSSTPNSTVCHCNHLTNFAILLSARPLDLPRDKTLALQITGYIGVSVSLVAMAATILVFIFLKPLRTMRNYIHIQLCVTLGIAQIIFVAGVEPRLGEGSGVLIGCRSVAVLLHYWFLVSFMWMLMEGVVLYVALVRVFVKHYARYIAAFTITSYGLPLLYVGALMLPLGFVRTSIYRQYHSYDYGYEQACYLNPDTSFVWSLIAPVIMIFLANFGFFIMAIAIMYRHQKRQHTEKKIHKVKHWIKASISLTVVMGITWIIGVLVIEVEELFALAYIFTIFVAFQGVFIFVIFVLFSKQVRENYAKWWKAKIAESDFLSKHFGDKTLGTGLTAQNKTPLPSYDKIDQKSSSTASKKCLEQSQAIEIESSYSQHKLPTVTVNSHDNGSHGSSVINDGATPLAALTENCFSFNITYIPSSVPLDSTASLSDSIAPLCDNNWSTDIKGEESEGSGDDIMEEVELHTRRATPNDYVLTNSFVCDPIIEDDQSSKL